MVQTTCTPTSVTKIAVPTSHAITPKPGSTRGLGNIVGIGGGVGVIVDCGRVAVVCVLVEFALGSPDGSVSPVPFRVPPVPFPPVPPVQFPKPAIWVGVEVGFGVKVGVDVDVGVAVGVGVGVMVGCAIPQCLKDLCRWEVLDRFSGSGAIRC